MVYWRYVPEFCFLSRDQFPIELGNCTDHLNIWIDHLNILFPLNYFCQCIKNDQQQSCVWSIPRCGRGCHGVRRSKTAGLVIRGGQLPLWEAVSHLLASCLARGPRRRVLYSLPGRDWEGGSCCLQLIEVQPTPGGHIVCLIQANIQGGRMNRVDIQIVPDDEGYREVGIIFWIFE